MVSGLGSGSGPARSPPHRHPCPALGLLCSLPVLGWGSSRATHVRLKVFSERLLLLLRHRQKPCGCLILSLNASPSCSQDNGSLCNIVTNDARRRPCRLPNDQSGQSCHHTLLLVPPLTPSPLPPTQSKLTQFNPSTENFADNMCRMWWLLLIYCTISTERSIGTTARKVSFRIKAETYRNLLICFGFH